MCWTLFKIATPSPFYRENKSGAYTVQLTYVFPAEK